MHAPPDVITITDFRRNAARIIDGPVAHGIPVFVTQNGCVTAVVITRERYNGLLHRSALLRAATASAGEARPRVDYQAAPAGLTDTQRRPAVVMSRYGHVDPETAGFLEAEGFAPGVGPADREP